ncbi:hypothetical protein Mal64_13310 [Pseudobythopirellula maris]|uniref:Uncharacterized protein n=1 Tax=Pseudobythopirellula maris TaxID=2527991 RepID=A0A5C5ZTS2_9BACT|nr:hypothetical protein [Pseudobythopirellula maris]TWT90932.1 hypothetical protein Mal64_13310 [Pseudobythopirellula maris]
MRDLKSILAVAVVTAAVCSAAASAEAHNYMKPLYRASSYSWNGNYAHTQYGQPVAMVVPPTAQLQTNWGWGVGSSRVSRADHQFGRNYPGAIGGGGGYRTTPVWPQDTMQFGVYNVRGPW